MADPRPETRGGDRSIATLQRDDHARTERLIHEYVERSTAGRRETFRAIVDLVTTHAFAEEEVLLPLARRALGDRGEELTTTIESEHQRVNELLAEMEGSNPGEWEFDTRVAELFTLLRSDARREEDQLLPALAGELDEDQLRRLGTAWLLAKKAAPNRAHPHIPRRPPGNVLAGIPLLAIDRVRGWLARRRGTSQ